MRRKSLYPNYSPEEIDRPVIVKLPEAKRKVERGFFFAVNKEDFEVKLNELLRNNVIDNKGLKIW